MNHSTFLNYPCRRATPADAQAMAELVNMAGEGLPLYLWSRMAAPGQSAWELGQERARREAGAFSYRNTIVREHNNAVVACLIGYPLEAAAAPTDYSQLPAMFVPLQQLEDLAPDTWYINVLATYSDYRGKGIGGELLTVAEAIAVDAGKRGLSLVVADSNLDARRLYERHGYQECARRPMVIEQWENAGTSWILMCKDL